MTGWKAYLAEQHQHGSQPTLRGDDGFICPYPEGTFENSQSEFLQLLSMVV